MYKSNKQTEEDTLASPACLYVMTVGGCVLARLKQLSIWVVVEMEEGSAVNNAFVAF